MAHCKIALQRAGKQTALSRLLRPHNPFNPSAEVSLFTRAKPLKPVSSCKLNALKGYTNSNAQVNTPNATAFGGPHPYHSSIFHSPLRRHRYFKSSHGGEVNTTRTVRTAAAKLGSDATSSEFRYFATCTPGLEKIVAEELASPLIDAQNVSPARAGVAFTGGLAVGYRANLWLRCAVRVLIHMAEGELVPWRPAGDEVYDFIRGAVDWQALLLVGGRNGARRCEWAKPPESLCFPFCCENFCNFQ